MAKEVKKIETWLRRQIYSRGKCVRIELRHLSMGKRRGQAIQEWHPEKRVEERSLVEMSQTIEESAQEDANGMGKLQRYVLLAYFEDDDGDPEPKGRLVFRMNASEEDEDGDELDSEPPTKQGLVAQQMRHNEAIMRNSTFAAGQMMACLRAENNELRQEISKLRDERRENIEAYESLLSLAHERDLKTKEHEFMLKAKGEAWEKISLLAPAVINRMMGKKLLPEKTTPESMALKAFMDSVTPEQMGRLQEVFTPDQLISILQLYETNRNKDQNGVSLESLASPRKEENHVG